MRTRTIVFALLAVYAVGSTAYFVFHLANSPSTSQLDRSRSTADDSLPIAPPFEERKAPPLAGQDLLARVQIENELRYTDLQSFVCKEQMDRYRGRLKGENPRQIDTVTAQVSFENGVENYIGIQQNSRQRQAMSEIPGAWSEGEFGTLLRQTRTLLTSQPLTSKISVGPRSEPAVNYSLEVSGQDSPWQLTVDKETYRVPFRTDVLVSQIDGRILNIRRVSTAMPPSFGISEIEWSVNLKPINLEGKEWLLPISGEYAVSYQKSNRREWNSIQFSDYHRYTASSIMHF